MHRREGGLGPDLKLTMVCRKSSSLLFFSLQSLLLLALLLSSRLSLLFLFFAPSMVTDHLSSPTGTTPSPRRTVSTSRTRVSRSEVPSLSTRTALCELRTFTTCPLADPSKSLSESSRPSSLSRSTEKSAPPVGRREKTRSTLPTSSSTLRSSKSRACAHAIFCRVVGETRDTKERRRRFVV